VDPFTAETQSEADDHDETIGILCVLGDSAVTT
jgi:hypothetical protein